MDSKANNVLDLVHFCSDSGGMVELEILRPYSGSEIKFYIGSVL
jgi:hypothetical protein